MLDAAWIVALVFGVLSGLLAASWRRGAGRVAELEARAASLDAERARVEGALAKESAARAKLAEELAGHRRKADKARRREARTPEVPLGTATRIRDFEERIARAEAAGERLRAERDALAARVAELEAGRAADAERVRAAEAKPAPAPVVMPAPDAAAALEALRGELAASQERVTKLEAEIEQARLVEARMRKRTSNQEQLYASLRAELDVKKDRLRAQEELIQRLQDRKSVV